MAAPRWLDEREERAWRGYRRMRALLDLQITRDLAQTSGLSDADYDVLSTLSESHDNSWRVSELAARLLWSASRLSHQLTRMERRGLVVRQAAADDARGAVVRLTQHGLRTLRAAAPAHVESVRRHFIDLLSDAQLRALASMSDSVVAHLSGDAAQ